MQSSDMPSRFSGVGQPTHRAQEDHYADVHLIEGVFTPVQKRQMIEKLTDAMVSIEGENMRGVTWVTIEEKRSGDWGIGGQPLTTEAVQALSAGKASP